MNKRLCLAAKRNWVVEDNIKLFGFSDCKHQSKCFLFSIRLVINLYPKYSVTRLSTSTMKIAPRVEESDRCKLII